MPSSTAELLNTIEHDGVRFDTRPWGAMMCMSSWDHDVTIKYIMIQIGARTSLQYHKHKDELLIILEDYGEGYIALGEDDAAELHTIADGRLVRVRPGMRHRVIGPMKYMEISTYDDDTDTVRVSDDYGRIS